MKLIREMEEKEAKIIVQNDGEKPGRCPNCDATGFSLKAKPGIIERTCKKCGDVKTF